MRSLHDDLGYARALINTVHDALLVLDRDLRIQEANRSFYALFQTTPQAVTNRLVYELWDSDELKHLLETIISQDDDVRDYYLTHAFPHIGERIMQLNARRFLGRSAQPLVLLAIKDVTERQRAHLALEHYASELARSNDELDQFAFLASHDLQAPLRTIISYLRLLKERYQGELGTDADDFIAFTINSAAHLQQMTHDLLQYAQINQKPIDVAPVDLQDVLDRALADLPPTAEAHAVAIANEPLPTVRGDAEQLRHLLRHLLDNAIKFSGDKPPEVYIGARQDDEGWWTISVQDDGIGIEPEHCERIFELFQRVYGHTEFPGSGMGLAVAKKIVEQHGGRIWVRSQPGHGAVFYFTLPERFIDETV